MKRLLLPVLVVALLASACGRVPVKFENLSLPQQFCQSILPDTPMLYAAWVIRPSRAFTVERMALVPTHQPGVRLVKQFVETRNSAGEFGGEWVHNRTDGVPLRWNYDRYLGVRLPNGLKVRVHQQIVFSVVLDALHVGYWKWKGLRVYHDGTSTLLLPAIAISVTHNADNPKVKSPCKIPPLTKGAV